MSDESARQDSAAAYWKEHVRLLLTLLVIWFVVPFIFGILLAPLLNNVLIGGYPLGFWIAQQGSIYLFLILILVYVFKMNTLDRKYNVHEE
ncbi:DUF4212 domain-containing protein [Arhodomonas sp. SL1]|uniref:DUF4212 domain-containing protein n=1 Tax=Arhodomonas sp. SL1 TaxID=3425691 RepID=UPI003F884E24